MILKAGKISCYTVACRREEQTSHIYRTRAKQRQRARSVLSKIYKCSGHNHHHRRTCSEELRISIYSYVCVYIFTNFMYIQTVKLAVWVWLFRIYILIYIYILLYICCVFLIYIYKDEVKVAQFWSMYADKVSVMCLYTHI